MTLSAHFVSLCFATYRIFARMFVFAFYPLVKRGGLARTKRLHINYNGPEPSDIQVLSEEYFKRLAVDWSLGFGEGYLDQLWTAKDLPGAIGCAMKYGSSNALLHPLGFLYSWFNLQQEGEDAQAVAEHYNFGNDWFEGFMGPNMQYTCGYWKTAKNLEEAQFDKMELIAKKLQLKSGMRVCDFGCGWGTLAMHLAKYHGVSIVGITISVEQAKYVNDRIGKLPIEVRICDYRDMNEIGTFDRVTAIGFMEHIGPHNYKTLYKIVNQCLKNDGLALVQVITRNAKKFKYGMEPFAHKYIFPNGFAPSHMEILKAFDGIMILEDWASHGQYYTKTLEAWRAKFHKAWPEFKAKYKYDDRVFRIWDYYFSAAIALFSERQFTLCQLVLSRGGLQTGRDYIRD